MSQKKLIRLLSVEDPLIRFCQRSADISDEGSSFREEVVRDVSSGAAERQGVRRLRRQPEAQAAARVLLHTGDLRLLLWTVSCKPLIRVKCWQGAEPNDGYAIG